MVSGGEARRQSSSRLVPGQPRLGCLLPRLHIDNHDVQIALRPPQPEACRSPRLNLLPVLLRDAVSRGDLVKLGQEGFLDQDANSSNRRSAVAREIAGAPRGRPCEASTNGGVRLLQENEIMRCKERPNEGLLIILSLSEGCKQCL